MKDFTGAELQHNDLVVSKPGGRYASMKYGLIRDELKASVWFSRGSWGGSDIVRIDCTNRPDMEKKRQDMIKKREDELVERDVEKARKKKAKLKKSELTLYGVFEGNYDREIYLGKCKIDGEIKENVWLGLSYPYTKQGEEPKREISDLYFRRGWGRNFRSVKYPQKFKKLHQLTEAQVIEMFGRHTEYYNSRGNSYYNPKPYKIELLNEEK